MLRRKESFAIPIEIDIRTLADHDGLPIDPSQTTIKVLIIRPLVPVRMAGVSDILCCEVLFLVVVYQLQEDAVVASRKGDMELALLRVVDGLLSLYERQASNQTIKRLYTNSDRSIDEWIFHQESIEP